MFLILDTSSIAGRSLLMSSGTQKIIPVSVMLGAISYSGIAFTAITYFRDDLMASLLEIPPAFLVLAIVISSASLIASSALLKTIFDNLLKYAAAAGSVIGLFSMQLVVYASVNVLLTAIVSGPLFQLAPHYLVESYPLANTMATLLVISSYLIYKRKVSLKSILMFVPLLFVGRMTTIQLLLIFGYACLTFAFSKLTIKIPDKLPQRASIIVASLALGANLIFLGVIEVDAIAYACIIIILFLIYVSFISIIRTAGKMSVAARNQTQDINKGKVATP